MKKLSSPLLRRIPRQLWEEKGKYLALFVMMVLMIAEVSGFMVANGSMIRAYDESFEKYTIEDGHFTLKEAADEATLAQIEASGVTVYNLFYIDRDLTAVGTAGEAGNESGDRTAVGTAGADGNESGARTAGQTLRFYAQRTDVDRADLMSGAWPERADEIALDRMFAVNNDIAVGDTVSAGGHTWTVTGFVALSDYSCLFENNSDTMFDAVQFGVALLTQEGFDALAQDGESSVQANYAWLYNTTAESSTAAESSAVTEASEAPADSDSLAEAAENTATKTATAAAAATAADGSETSATVQIGDEAEREAAEDLMKAINAITPLKAFVPRYENQAITFTGDDMEGDLVMTELLLYILIAILAFVFAVTVSSTITAEAGVIGTLRATGYTKRELLRHYLALPVLVTLAAALLGNVLGYTYFKTLNADLYYASYSLPTYHTVWNAEAFLKTTVGPVLLMAAITCLVIRRALRLPVIRFLRRETGSVKLRKALKLPHTMDIFRRFRLRVIWQNLGNYVVMFAGSFAAVFLMTFGLSLPALLDACETSILDDMFCRYQYILQIPAELGTSDSLLGSALALVSYSLSTVTANEDAESFTAYTLESTGHENWRTDEILLYGVEDNSRYVALDTASLGEGEVIVSSLLADKYSLVNGSTFSLKEPYSDDTCTFTVAAVADYEASLAVFLGKEELNKTVGLPASFTCGYFSDSEITDIDSRYIATVIDEESLTRLTRQLDVSMGSMMDGLSAVSAVLFLILVSLLAGIIIRRNERAVSLTRILGYHFREIAKLYIRPTTVMVVLFLLLSVPLSAWALLALYRFYLPLSMTGWFPMHLEKRMYVIEFAAALAAYAVSAAVQYRRILKVPMEQALKNVE